MHDAGLLRLIQQGDSAAWRAFYIDELPAVWRYAYALVGDRVVAEDICSETMLAMLQNIEKFDPDTCRIHAWLRSVVAHKAADHFRRTSRREKMAASVRNDSTSASQPPEIVEMKEKRQHIMEVLDSLPEPQRLSLEWKYCDGLSVREIAVRLDQTEKSVEAMLFRARRKFRQLYDSYDRTGIMTGERGKSEQDDPGGSR